MVVISRTSLKKRKRLSKILRPAISCGVLVIICPFIYFYGALSPSFQQKLRSKKIKDHIPVVVYLGEEISSRERGDNIPLPKQNESNEYVFQDIPSDQTDANLFSMEEVRDEEWYASFRHTRYHPYKNAPECHPIHNWQSTSRPSCNKLHELHIATGLFALGHGFFRDVWAMEDGNYITRFVLKTLRTNHNFDEQNYERHRMDATALDQLTGSPNVLDIYAYCGMSSISELADGSSIKDRIDRNGPNMKIMNSLERLVIASQVAEALADVHRSKIIHADVMVDQFILKNGVYKLNDFNRCVFQYQNSSHPYPTEICPYHFEDENAWIFRSPEEYSYDSLTEKIDIYSMGNIFYTLLEEKLPFEDVKEHKGTEAVQKLVRRGVRPNLQLAVEQSQDHSIKVIIKAMTMCWNQQAKDRPSASDVRDYLLTELDRLTSNR
mmetsp:Transcript_6879/g.10879  ORF Transcript_6879/g.10879 Transcript_6879/m.10879 type:complete len:437 (-) Transcript_6879:239-1549(-)